MAPVIDPDAVVLPGELAGSPIAALAEAGSLTSAPPAAYPAAQGAARMMLARLFEFSAGADGNPGTLGGWQSIVDRFPGYSS